MFIISLFRNKDCRRDVIAWMILSVFFCTILFFYGGRKAGSICVLFSLSIFVYYFLSLGHRQKKIQRLTLRLDEVLHGQSEVLLADCEEGELAILHSELEKLLLRLQEQTEQLTEDKRFLADALADISHQLKTPLTSMRLILEKLGDATLSVEERRDLVRQLISFLERIDWLVYALLKISKLDAGSIALQQERVSLFKVVKRAVAPLAISMDIRGIHFVCDIPAELSFLGDATWSEEAIANILKNAMEHTPEGGIISVTATENPLYSQLVIHDTGADIPEEDLPHIFQRFYRGSRPATGGMGIGLSLSRKIIQAQQGTIRAYNHTDGGAVFAVRWYGHTV